MAPIALLLKTVFEAILEVFLLCLAGYILARKGILDKKTQKKVNRLNVSLFTPALLFSKVAFFLSPAKLKELWIIPIFFCLVTAVSMAVAHVLGWVFRLKRSQRNFAVAASMFMNSNSLPIALMQSLVVTVPTLKWDDDDSEDAMLGRALSYLVLYSTLGMVLRWSYGVHLLSQADPEGSEMDSALQDQEANGGSLDQYSDEPREGILIDVENGEPPTMTGSPSFSSTHVAEGDSDELNGKKRLIHPSTFASFPNGGSNSAVNLSAVSSSTTLHNRPSDSEDDDSYDDEPLMMPGQNRRRPAFRLNPTTRRYLLRIKKALKSFNKFMTMPLWAALLSLIVALVPPLQHSLDAHLQPIKGALNAAGNCSIPLTVVVLGAYFYTPSEKSSSTTQLAVNDQPIDRLGAQGHANGIGGREPSQASVRSSFAESMRSALRLTRLNSPPKKTQTTRLPGETRTVFIAVVSRMLLTPLVFLPLMALGARFDSPKIFDDPVFVVSNILLLSSPPALTLAQITQAASGDAFERLISRTIFWAYCVVTPPATIVYVVIGIIFADL